MGNHFIESLVTMKLCFHPGLTGSFNVAEMKTRFSECSKVDRRNQIEFTELSVDHQQFLEQVKFPVISVA